jgi:hypothetical protein
VRTDWLFQAIDYLTFRFVGQHFTEGSSGAAIKGFNDPTRGARKLSQNMDFIYDLESEIYGIIVEYDTEIANVKSVTSYQKDDIHGTTRDVGGFLQNFNGNELAKTPTLASDITFLYETELSSGDIFSTSPQWTYRGEFRQR